MSRSPLSRRTVLRGAGGIAVALPFLEAMRPARAATKPPRRLVLFFESNGYARANWTPTGADASFTFSPILKPLEPFRQDILIVGGLGIRAKGPGSPHMKGIGGLFTGSSLAEPSAASGNLSAGFATGPSLDQYVASKLGSTTKLRSLELGVQADNKATAETRMCFDANRQAIPPQNSPSAVFGRVFSGVTVPTAPQNPGMVTPTPAPTPAVDPRVLQRRSVLDFLKDDYQTLSARLGSEDRRRVAAHLESVRELERQLNVGSGRPGGEPAPGVQAPTPSLACQKPTATAGGGQACSAQDNCSDAAVATIGKQQMDLLVMALACDLTRVASLQWSNCGNRIVYRSLGLTQTHHDLGHAADIPALTKINTWYAEQFAYLLGRMKQVKEADGSSLLDNSVVLWGNELASGAAHNHNPMPFVVAGRGGGHFRTGRYLAASGPHNALLVSCLNAMGINDQSFGNLAPNTGPLPGMS